MAIPEAVKYQSHCADTQKCFKTTLSRYRKAAENRVAHTATNVKCTFNKIYGARRVTYKANARSRKSEQKSVAISLKAWILVIYYEDFGNWGQHDGEHTTFLKVDVLPVKAVLQKSGRGQWQDEVENFLRD